MAAQLRLFTLNFGNSTHRLRFGVASFTEVTRMSLCRCDYLGKDDAMRKPQRKVSCSMPWPPVLERHCGLASQCDMRPCRVRKALLHPGHS